MAGNFAPVTRELGDIVSFHTVIGAIAGSYNLNVAVGEQWRVLNAHCSLATAGGGGNRVVNAGYSLDAGQRFLGGNTVAQVGGLSWTYSFYINAPVPNVVLGTQVLADMPEAIIGPGLVPKFWLQVDNAFVGDNISNISVTYQRWRV